MATESIQVSGVINASADQIYDAWLDAYQHSKFTGGTATVEPGIGGRFSAWDGYIQGTTLELEPGRRIVQSWRTTEFPAGSPDSRLEVVLEPIGDATRITLRHSEIPEGQGGRYEQGWKEHYLTRMTKFFGEEDDVGAGGSLESTEPAGLASADDEMAENRASPPKAPKPKAEKAPAKKAASPKKAAAARKSSPKRAKPAKAARAKKRPAKKAKKKAKKKSSSKSARKKSAKKSSKKAKKSTRSKKRR